MTVQPETMETPITEVARAASPHTYNPRKVGRPTLPI